MPNTFAPRAVSNVVKDTTKRLRLKYPGDTADVKEWHAIVHNWNADATEAFLEEYSRVEEIPYIVDGVGREVGFVPDEADDTGRAE